jgi:hypothetical protein
MPKNKVRFANFFLFKSTCDACGDCLCAKVRGGGTWAFYGDCLDHLLERAVRRLYIEVQFRLRFCIEYYTHEKLYRVR